MNKIKRFALLNSVAALAFDTGAAGWKMDGDKIATDASGNPIYLQAGGGEQVIEVGTISRLNAEAKSHREAKEAAESKLKVFEGLDPAKAREALDTVGKLDQKKLIDAGEVDRVRQEIASQYQGQLAEAQKGAESLQSRVDSLLLETAFGKSKFIQHRVAVPPEMFVSTFGKNFKIEDGKPVPYDSAGNKIYSKTRMGEVADIDEAFSIMVDGYAHKDSILRANGHGGSGNNGNGGARGGSRVMKRSEFDALTPAERANAAAAMGKGELTIVD